MPRKGGSLTGVERQIAATYAVTGSQEFAAFKAGVTRQGVSAALQRPAVQAEATKAAQDALFGELLPLAVAAHKRLLSDPKTPAGAVVQAVKLAYDRTLGADGAQSKEPHEMTGEELATAIAALERVAAERAKPVQADQAAESDQGGVFE